MCAAKLYVQKQCKNQRFRAASVYQVHTQEYIKGRKKESIFHNNNKFILGKQVKVKSISHENNKKSKYLRNFMLINYYYVAF